MSLFTHSLLSDDELSRYSDRLRDGRPGFDSRLIQQIFLYSTASRPAHQPSVRLVRGDLSLWAKRPGPEADHLPPSSAEVKNGGAIHPLPSTPS
jgi:hypothetical protein